MKFKTIILQKPKSKHTWKQKAKKQTHLIDFKIPKRKRGKSWRTPTLCSLALRTAASATSLLAILKAELKFFVFYFLPFFTVYCLKIHHSHKPKHMPSHFIVFFYSASSVFLLWVIHTHFLHLGQLGIKRTRTRWLAF